MSPPLGTREGLPVGGDQGAAELAPGGDRDLLAQHRADGELVRIGGARGPQSRPQRDQRRERGIGAEPLADRVRVGVQVEQAPDPLGRRRQVAQIAEVQMALEPARSRAASPTSATPVPCGQLQGPPVRPRAPRSPVSLLDAGDGPLAQVVEDLGRRVRAAVGEPQRHPGRPFAGADRSVA